MNTIPESVIIYFILLLFENLWGVTITLYLMSLFHIFSYLTRLCSFYISCSMMLMIIDVNSFL